MFNIGDKIRLVLTESDVHRDWLIHKDDVGEIIGLNDENAPYIYNIWWKDGENSHAPENKIILICPADEEEFTIDRKQLCNIINDLKGGKYENKQDQH